MGAQVKIGDRFSSDHGRWIVVGWVGLGEELAAIECSCGLKSTKFVDELLAMKPGKDTPCGHHKNRRNRGEA